MRNWYVVAVVLAAGVIASTLRLPLLNQRPMHTDEAVHAVKFDILYRTGIYEYDVADYHGPTLYYAAVPVVCLTGADGISDVDKSSFRLVTALFGIAIVLAFALFIDGVGRGAVCCAAVFVAVSPAMVYYSRYFIQEMLLAFFTLAMLGCAWRLIRSRYWGWAIAAGVCAGLAHATKETFLIAMFAVAVGTVVEVLIARRNLDRQSIGCRFWWMLGASCGVGAIVSIACYSVFFQTAAGPIDSIRSIWSYAHRAGGVGIHEHPWYYYLQMLLWTHHSPGPVFTEGVILVFAFVGSLYAFFGRESTGGRQTLLRFLSAYTLIVTATYCLIPYKTPWCAVQLLLPMILLAGVGAAATYRAIKSKSLRMLLALLVLAGVVHLGVQAHAAAFVLHSSNRNPYSYAHPVRDVERLADWIERLADVHSRGREMDVWVVGGDSWPLPWYLRRFPNACYWEEVPSKIAADLLLVDSCQQEALVRQMSDQAGEPSYRAYHYGIRRDLVMVMYLRESLYQSFVEREAPMSAPASNGERVP